MTQNPADPGVKAADPTQGARVRGGLRVLSGKDVGGATPNPAGAARRAVGESRQQGQLLELQRRRKMGERDRLRQGAQGAGFDRSGGLMWHRQGFIHTNGRLTGFFPISTRSQMVGVSAGKTGRITTALWALNGIFDPDVARRLAIALKFVCLTQPRLKVARVSPGIE